MAQRICPIRWTPVGNRGFRRPSFRSRLVVAAAVAIVGGAGRFVQAATNPSQVLGLLILRYLPLTPQKFGLNILVETNIAGNDINIGIWASDELPMVDDG